MSSVLPLTGWARQPTLWIDQDFDDDQNEGSIITPAGAVNSLFSKSNMSWQFSPIAVAALSCQKVSDGSRNGVFNAQSGNGVGSGVAIVWTGETNNITTGRVLSTAIPRWDWWVKTDGGSVANYELFAGLSDDWTARGTAANAVLLTINASDSGTFFITRVRSAGGNNGTVTARAYAVNSWYKLSAVRTDSAWIFLVNDNVVGTDATPFTGGLVMPGASCFVDTGGSTGKIMSWDKCQVWTDGSNLIT